MEAEHLTTEQIRQTIKDRLLDLKDEKRDLERQEKALQKALHAFDPDGRSRPRGRHLTAA